MDDFSNGKVFWTKSMNLKLVKYIEQRPHMWSPKHPNYTSVKAREKTYAKFASKYDDLLTPLNVKERWTNIRCTFGHYVRKSRQKRLKGEEDYKVHWHLWGPCQFLLQANRKAENESFNGSQLPKVDEGNSDDSEDLNHEAGSSNQCYEITENLVKVFKNIPTDEFLLDNSTHGQIGRLVAEKLSLMNTYEAAKLSSKIMNILLMYDSNNPSNPNNVDTLSSENKIEEQNDVNCNSYLDTL